MAVQGAVPQKPSLSRVSGSAVALVGGNLTNTITCLRSHVEGSDPCDHFCKVTNPSEGVDPEHNKVRARG